MTCIACGREVTLLDGYYCGQCLGELSAAIADAIEDVEWVDGDLADVQQWNDGYVHARIDAEGDVLDDV